VLAVRLVIVESPYAGDEDLAYLRACMRDCIMRGESPYASHGLLTQPGVLDDAVPKERALGIAAGFDFFREVLRRAGALEGGVHRGEVREKADATVVYVDRGISGGMEAGIEHATKIGHPIEYRRIL